MDNRPTPLVETDDEPALIAPKRRKKRAKPAKPTEKRGRGRPSQWDPIFEGRTYKYALMGATNEKIAEFLGISISTFERWQRERPEFKRCLEKGRHDADATVARTLFKKATGYYKRTEKATASGQVVTVKEYFPPDTGSAIFWLKNRKPETWRDKQQHDHMHTLTLSEEFENFVRALDGERHAAPAIKLVPTVVEGND
jgi:hypothetical protein